MYIRIVSGTEKERMHSLHGVFTEAKLLRDDNILYEYEEIILEEIFEWFNKNLDVPPFSENNWPENAVSWFKEDAQLFISKMYEIVAILKEHNVQVRTIKSDDPGTRIYEDAYQVIAINSKY